MRTLSKQMITNMLIGFLIIFISLGIFIMFQVNRLPDSLRFTNQEIANARAAEISKEIKAAKETVAMMSETIPLIMDNEPLLRTFLVDAADHHDTFRNFTISDESGLAWTTYGMTIDISDQEQFISIMQEGADFSVSQPFMSPFIEEDVPIITVAYPLYSEGELIGLFNGVISLAFLTDVISDINYQDTGYAYIVNQSGQFVSHPLDIIGIDDNLDEFIEDTFLPFEASKGVLDYYNLDNIRVLGFYHEIEASPGWVFILAIPQREVLQTYYTLMQFMIIGFTLTIVALTGFIVTYAKTITKPITELDKVFKEAAIGNLDVKANEQPYNEIGRAAKSFNIMLEQIKTLSFLDPVTKVDNVNRFRINFQRFIKPDAYYALILISTDDFRRVNSIGGVEAGDAVLQQMAITLETFIKDSDLLARYHGDEFVVLLKDASTEKLYERIRQLEKIYVHDFSFRNLVFHLNASIGVTIFNGSTPGTLDGWLKEANLAKHYAKKEPNTITKFYDETMKESLTYEKNLEDAIEQAIEQDEFYMVYQPIVNVQDQQIIGAEALLRWHNETYKDLPIIEVINIAERKGFMVKLGKIILRHVFEDFQHQTLAPNFILSINVSAVQLEDKRFIDHLKTCLNTHGINPYNIYLEITETQLMSNLTNIETLHAIKTLGIKLSIDDFGTKYSSLAYFTEYPIDILKLDRQFIVGIDQDKRHEAITKAVIKMAHELDIKVIAEGVETISQRQKIEAFKCKYYQGFIYSEPIRRDAFLQTLKEKGAYHASASINV